MFLLLFHCLPLLSLVIQDWYKYAVYNDSDYSLANFSASNIEFADHLNVGGISTSSGDLVAFKARGGKFLTYHGRSDGVCTFLSIIRTATDFHTQIVPSGNSNRMYERVASNFGNESLDDFYRFFRIPGMFFLLNSEKIKALNVL